MLYMSNFPSLSKHAGSIHCKILHLPYVLIVTLYKVRGGCSARADSQEKDTCFPRAAAKRADGIFPHFTSLSVLSFLMPHCSFFTLFCLLGSDSTPAEVNGGSPTDFIWLCLRLPAISPLFSYAWTQIPALTSQQFGSCLCIVSPLTSCTLPRASPEQEWGKAVWNVYYLGQ